MNKENENALVKKYRPLANAAGFGSMLGSGIIIGLSTTLAVWQDGLHLTNSQTGLLSALLTLMIGFGSLFGGRIAESIGLIKTFNWTNFFYLIGALLCIFSKGIISLSVGLVIVGLISGMDLPVSLAVISRDAPNKTVNNKLVSFTQIYWQIGTFVSSIGAFIVSKVEGTLGARIVFGILAVIALITWLWRTLSKKFKEFHKLGSEKISKKDEDDNDISSNKSVSNVLFHQGAGKYLKYFVLIFLYYCLWNLLANTWGQFGTYMMRRAHASQTFSTGAGLIISFIVIGAVAFFSKISANDNSRIRSFVIGGIVTFLSFVLLGFFGKNIWGIVFAQFAYQVGATFAGEALYKVWTQESFPTNVRSSIQGIINGVSRLLCAAFAIITPTLVEPSHINNTMWAFSVVVIIYIVIGIIMNNAQKKYGIPSDNK